jgi:hypothetical protein
MAHTPRPKRQHYVPRFYLEHFIDDNGRVWTYDNQKNEVRDSVPKQTAVETNFYSILNDDGGYHDDLEHWLQGVEDKAAQLYPRVLKGETLSGQDRADFAVFLSSLYARSPAIVTAYAEMTGYMVQHLTNLMFADRKRFEDSMDSYDADRGKTTSPADRDKMFEFANDKSRYVLAVDKKRGLSAIGVADNLTPLFFDMSWIVFESRDQHIITSDNPVVRVSPPADYHPIYGDGGFLNKNVNVSIPLTPDRVLVLFWKKDVPSGLLRVNKAQGRTFNVQRAHYSERYLYSSRRDGGIQALGQKYRKPGLRLSISGSEGMAPVEVRRKLSK